MSPDDNLRATVDDVGVFGHLKASDGQEAHFDMIEFGWQRGPVFGGAVLACCRVRINEQPANTLSPEVRSELLAEPDPESLPKTDLEEASERYGHSEPISHEWLDEKEARAMGASAVSGGKERSEAEGCNLSLALGSAECSGKGQRLSC